MEKIVACCLFSLLVVSANPLCAQHSNAQSVAPKELAYTRTLNERVAKIMASLGLADRGKSNLVHNVIVQQYQDLADIHLVRGVQIENAKIKFASDKAAANAAIQSARDEAKPKLEKLHGWFLANLSAELSSEQVDQVKDGMTYGVVGVTYNTYLKMYPELTDEQKKQIMAWLVEAREIAMDGSTSDEKHAVFGKYKGRINNYLSKAGYDAKKGEANLKKASQPSSETKSK